MKKAAVIIDGGFVRITFQKYFKRKDVPTPDHILLLGSKVLNDNEELFRIYYYDCLPFEKELKKPISKEIFFNKELVLAGKKFISALSLKDWIAYRSGQLKFGGWSLKQEKIDEIIKSKRCITDDDFRPLFKQKRIDIKIGLDIAWLSIRKIVDRIILIAGDSDFVPAMKLARIEGIQIVTVPLKNPVNPDMKEHSDEIREFDISKL